MLTFTVNNDDYVFLNDGEAVAFGAYDNGEFHLYHNDRVSTFANAIQSFIELKKTYEPNRIVSRETLNLINTPMRPVDKLSQYMAHKRLIGMSEDVFHALEHKK